MPAAPAAPAVPAAGSPRAVVRRFVEEYQTLGMLEVAEELLAPDFVLMGVAPTGKAVAFDVIDIVRVRDGRLCEHWNVVDQLSLLRQLGSSPDPGKPPPVRDRGRALAARPARRNPRAAAPFGET